MHAWRDNTGAGQKGGRRLKDCGWRASPHTAPVQTTRVIPIHAHAPAKPAWGQPCNGCGVCCLARPCPVGIVLNLRVKGPCRMLRWDGEQARYLCGALLAVEAVPGWDGRLGRLLGRATSRWIAAGAGCDCDIELESEPES